MSDKKCIGFDEHGNDFPCPNIAGTPWTNLWCDECDERRRKRISKSLEEMKRKLQGGE